MELINKKQRSEAERNDEWFKFEATRMALFNDIVSWDENASQPNQETKDKQMNSRQNETRTGLETVNKTERKEEKNSKRRGRNK